jgi:hypothetical protein
VENKKKYLNNIGKTIAIKKPYSAVLLLDFLKRRTVIAMFCSHIVIL